MKCHIWTSLMNKTLSYKGMHLKEQLSNDWTMPIKIWYSEMPSSYSCCWHHLECWIFGTSETQAISVPHEVWIGLGAKKMGRWGEPETQENQAMFKCVPLYSLQKDMFPSECPIRFILILQSTAQSYWVLKYFAFFPCSLKQQRPKVRSCKKVQKDEPNKSIQLADL